MKLFHSPGACSLAPHIVAREAGLSLTYDKVDLKSHKTQGGADFTQINPKGYVPVLELDNGEILTEVSAIIQYLADKAPDSGLMPAVGSLERYRVLEWIGFVSTEIHKGFSPLFKPDTPEAYKTIAVKNLNRRFGLLDKALAGHHYLTGDRFTVADAYLFTVLRWTVPMQIDLSDYKNIVAFMARVAERPGANAALREEGLLPAA
ncbi:glutathione transferase GstA [Microvirga antarctica]|uniref:glutathione transferase GstA n=1 Tax=Microvirga antarctica TaxID=2819233 RepID=UPI001B30CF01|nr:glutathione transferase GstA [Microvirga antarctica]